MFRGLSAAQPDAKCPGHVRRSWHVSRCEARMASAVRGRPSTGTRRSAHKFEHHLGSPDLAASLGSYPHEGQLPARAVLQVHGAKVAILLMEWSEYYIVIVATKWRPHLSAESYRTRSLKSGLRLYFEFPNSVRSAAFLRKVGHPRLLNCVHFGWKLACKLVGPHRTCSEEHTGALRVFRGARQRPLLRLSVLALRLPVTPLASVVALLLRPGCSGHAVAPQLLARLHS